jgi:hypothetical protein
MPSRNARNALPGEPPPMSWQTHVSLAAAPNVVETGEEPTQGPITHGHAQGNTGVDGAVNASVDLRGSSDRRQAYQMVEEGPLLSTENCRPPSMDIIRIFRQAHPGAVLQPVHHSPVSALPPR